MVSHNNKRNMLKTEDDRVMPQNQIYWLQPSWWKSCTFFLYPWHCLTSRDSRLQYAPSHLRQFLTWTTTDSHLILQTLYYFVVICCCLVTKSCSTQERQERQESPPRPCKFIWTCSSSPSLLLSQGDNQWGEHSTGVWKLPFTDFLWVDSYFLVIAISTFTFFWYKV